MLGVSTLQAQHRTAVPNYFFTGELLLLKLRVVLTFEPFDSALSFKPFRYRHFSNAQNCSLFVETLSAPNLRYRLLITKELVHLSAS